MKKLTLIRHAKSDWGSGAVSDFERPLNRRGNKAVPQMAGSIRERDSVPDLLVSSPAQRAAETAALLAQELELAQEQIAFNQDIYEASLKTLIEIVCHLPEPQRIALIGHNPGLSELGLWLCSQAPDWLPTCGVLELELAITDWSAATPGCATLICYDYPKKEIS